MSEKRFCENSVNSREDCRLGHKKVDARVSSGYTIDSSYRYGHKDAITHYHGNGASVSSVCASNPSYHNSPYVLVVFSV